jgi:hypothetical protein
MALNILWNIYVNYGVVRRSLTGFAASNSARETENFRHFYAAFVQSARNEFIRMSDLRNYLTDVDKIRYSRCFTKSC